MAGTHLDPPGPEKTDLPGRRSLAHHQQPLRRPAVPAPPQVRPPPRPVLRRRRPPPLRRRRRRRGPRGGSHPQNGLHPHDLRPEGRRGPRHRPRTGPPALGRGNHPDPHPRHRRLGRQRQRPGRQTPDHRDRTPPRLHRPRDDGVLHPQQLPDDLLAAELEAEERALYIERQRGGGPGSATTVA